MRDVNTKKKTIINCLIILALVACAAGVVCYAILRSGATESTDATVESATQQPTQSVARSGWTVKSADELLQVIESEDFKECIAQGFTPVITVAESLVLTEDIVIPEPADMVFTTQVFGDSPYRIIIKTDKTADVRITCQTPDVISNALLIEGRGLNVSWKDGSDIGTVTRYFNVASYNGQSTTNLPGGSGTGMITGIALYNNQSKSTKYDLAQVSVLGNVVTVKVPFGVSDNKVGDVYFELQTEGATGTVSVPQAGKMTFGENVGSVTLTDNSGNSRVYALDVKRSQYDIPVVSITTDGPVLNKQDYVTGCMTIDGVEYPLRIKGRGNSSWNFPKKSYRLKLDTKAKLLDMKGDKDWVLVSAYPDKSLIRNCIVTDMAKVMDGLEYTPEHRLVDFFYNGEYMGVYTLAEKIEEGTSKVDLAADEDCDASKTNEFGFMIEYGWDYDSENIPAKDFFDTKYTLRLFVKEPKMEVAESREIQYIMRYMWDMEDAIADGGNYEKYIDMDSWVDWFIIVELTNNTEVSFYRSCYLYKKLGGKAYLGPVWDYDMAFGNFKGDIPTYDKWSSGEATYTYTKEKTLMRFLVKDEKFMNAVKVRWNEVKEELLATALAAVDKYSAQVEKSQAENFLKWNILGRQVGAEAATPAKCKTHADHVQYIRDFLNKRYQWMDAELNK